MSDWTQWVGKTNLVILLKLIAQSAQGKLSSAILRLGGIGPLLCDHKADGFSFLLKSTSNGVKPEKSHLSVTYKCELLRKGKEGSYQIQVERLQQVPHRNGAKEPDAVDVLVRGVPTLNSSRRTLPGSSSRENPSLPRRPC